MKRLRETVKGKAMRRTVKQVAKASGVSVRTLHYYDEIGLLKPAEVGDNGYRYYGREQMLRLQQILFYRELGLPLEEIRRTLDDPRFDRRVALLHHRAKLEAEGRRLGRLIQTIDQTVAILEQETEAAMQDKDLFAGFSAEKQAQWEKEMEDRYGACGRETMAGSKARVEAMSPQERADFMEEANRLHAAFAEQMAKGAAADSAETQALAARHYAWVCRSWTPDAAAYAGLGRLYVEHDDFRAMYDGIRPGLAAYLTEAMEGYAGRALA